MTNAQCALLAAAQIDQSGDLENVFYLADKLEADLNRRHPPKEGEE